MDATSDALLSFVTLAAMEIVLGIDNIVFLSILVGRLPAERQPSARRAGLALALVLRLVLLLSISWVMGLTEPLLEVLGKAFSGRDLILLAGGLFLIWKSTHEIYDKLEVSHAHETGKGTAASYAAVLAQIALLDVVFSLDSVITAVGMAKHLWVMAAAMAAAVLAMLAFAGKVSDLVNRHPSLKLLGLSFLLLIGVTLVADGWGHHFPKGYIYASMAFSVFVELLNMRLRRRQAPLALHHPFEGETPPQAR